MNQWEKLEQLMTKEEKHRLYEMVRLQILMFIVRNGGHIPEGLMDVFDWQDDCYQVVYSRNFTSQKENHYQLRELIFFGIHESPMSVEFPEGEGKILVLRGKAAVKRLNQFIEHYLITPPQKNSPMYSLFFTCGEVVKKPEDIHESYNTAVKLMERRFFAGRDQHMLDENPLSDSQEQQPLGEEVVSRFCDALVDGIQTFNKTHLNRQVEKLYGYLVSCCQDEQTVRMFLMELCIRVRERLREKYPGAKQYGEDSRRMLQSIFKHDYLYEILDSMVKELGAIMQGVGAPSRDSVLNDILFYIQHNMGEQLKLERIAPLFGYNSAYLGKIFRQNVGASFNAYVDRVRIERAKELLQQEKLKVYEISERVGYRNVDYFHKKFLKNVGMSPAAYRKSVSADKGEAE